MNDTRKQRLPLGTARSDVLVLLAHNGGTWTRDSRWNYDNSAHWTEEILRSLASRGLVTEPQTGTYKITPDGKRRANSIATARTRF